LALDFLGGGQSLEPDKTCPLEVMPSCCRAKATPKSTLHHVKTLYVSCPKFQPVLCSGSAGFVLHEARSWVVLAMLTWIDKVSSTTQALQMQAFAAASVLCILSCNLNYD